MFAPRVANSRWRCSREGQKHLVCAPEDSGGDRPPAPMFCSEKRSESALLDGRWYLMVDETRYGTLPVVKCHSSAFSFGWCQTAYSWCPLYFLCVCHRVYGPPNFSFGHLEWYKDCWEPRGPKGFKCRQDPPNQKHKYCSKDTMWVHLKYCINRRNERVSWTEFSPLLLYFWQIRCFTAGESHFAYESYILIKCFGACKHTSYLNTLFNVNDFDQIE